MPDSTSPRVAVYTGVFDPVHLGHLDIIERGSRLFDRLVVGVGENPDKSSLFTVAERVQMLQRVVKRHSNVEIQELTGLAVRFVKLVGARIMLRGLRTLSDMEYEFTMSLSNHSLDQEIETIFLLAKEGFSHVSSSLIRQIARFHGELDKFVPSEVKDALVARVRELEAD